MGTPNGIERGLVAEAGYDYRGIEVGSFERSMDLDSLRHNAKSAAELLTLRRRAQAILREFPADPGDGHRRLRQLHIGKAQRSHAADAADGPALIDTAHDHQHNACAHDQNSTG